MQRFETSEVLEFLGSQDEAVPNLLLIRDPEFAARRGNVGVWQGDVVAWYQKVANCEVSTITVTPPQDDNPLVSGKEEYMQLSSNRNRQELTFASFVWRLIPLVTFVIITILMMAVDNLQPVFAASLLLAQLGALVIAIKAWIPRGRSSRRH